jgi:hypothetical protein
MSDDALKPFAVSIREAARLQGLGRKPGGGRNSIYQQIARGELEAVKDGAFTKITLASIERRQACLPRMKPSGTLGVAKARKIPKSRRSEA